MIPEVIQVIPNEDYTVYLYMDDNTVRVYDAKPLITIGGIFKALEDMDFFMNRCTIMNNTLAWDLSGTFDESNCIDICPDTIANCPVIEDVESLEKILFA